MSLSRRHWLILAFVLAAAVRLYRLDVPFVEPFNSISRLSICGSIARNFYEHGFNFFYPEIDENGNGPSLFSAEMPVPYYLMALAYKMTGGVHEGAARAVSVAFSLVSLWVLYLFIRRLSNERAALFALFFSAVSPMNVALARSIQCDTTMVFAGLLALYAFHVYRENGRWGWFFVSAFALALAVGTKIHSLCLLLPVIFLGWEKDGPAVFAKPRNYLYCLIALAPLSWYFYMWKISKSQPVAYDSFHYALGSYREALAPSLLKLPAKTLLLHILTPVGAVFFAAGVWKDAFKTAFVRAWLFSVLFYLLVMWPTAVVHPYYMLMLVPPLSFFVGIGADRLLASKTLGPALRNPLVIALFAALEAASVFYYYRLLYFIPPDRLAIVEAGKRVDAIAPKDALVIASYGFSPIQLYYCDRKGWSFNLEGAQDEALRREFEGRVASGADYFVTTQLDALHRLPDFENYLRSTYALVEKNENFVVFRLSGGPVA